MIIENLAILLGLLGVGLGIILAFSSKLFAVKEDPRLKEIEQLLPGVNCGSCGFPGCHGYAMKILEGSVPLNMCRPGGPDVAANLGKIMNKSVEAKEPMVAQRRCNGGKAEAKNKFPYEGIKSCRAATTLHNGFKECPYGCLGLGDCSDVCPVNAITIDKNGLPQINKHTCIGCEKCVKECPRSILQLIPKKSTVGVKCANHAAGKFVTKYCKVGCIACRMCEKKCPTNAIQVIDNLATIDYSKCTSCGQCVTVCPRKIIVNRQVTPQ